MTVRVVDDAEVEEGHTDARGRRAMGRYSRGAEVVGQAFGGSSHTSFLSQARKNPTRYLV
eukprot:CAMPEP_0172599940 /NCGR_PEP_ID=MMETSP1068-20121228/20072_1 /TAXON_ID=35684 /ORGANISM="Pseudopedinella elastica, Strain CCMP716" /LENGTH=59 /DNA_ID=CAMNT_0013400365 /DNA_START=359 /DNA_END=538 /DNA_ORIENTATION=-